MLLEGQLAGEHAPDFPLAENAGEVEGEGGAGVGVGGEEGGAHHQEAVAFGDGGIDEPSESTHVLLVSVSLCVGAAWVCCGAG